MKPPLQVIYYFLDEVTRMEHYLVVSELLLKEEHARYLKSLTADGDGEAQRYAHRRDLSADLADRFPQYHRRSSLLVFFGMFEENLDLLCRSVMGHSRIALAPRELGDRGIDRARIYLTKVGNWPLKQTSNWTKLKQIQTVRNLIAHSSGYLNESNAKEIEAIVKQNKHLSIESRSRKRLRLDAGLA